jgi:hypothetical protein
MLFYIGSLTKLASGLFDLSPIPIGLSRFHPASKLTGIQRTFL